MLSSQPRHFADDGTIVTVDLHGCSVDDSLYIVRRCMQEAYRRGRSKVDVIHGRSTSDEAYSERTIRNELHRRLESGEFGQWVSGRLEDASGGRTSLWINVGPSPDRTRIRMKDVVPR